MDVRRFVRSRHQAQHLPLCIQYKGHEGRGDLVGTSLWFVTFLDRCMEVIKGRDPSQLHWDVDDVAG